MMHPRTIRLRSGRLVVVIPENLAVAAFIGIFDRIDDGLDKLIQFIGADALQYPVDQVGINVSV